jgi:hypothetical protein
VVVCVGIDGYYEFLAVLTFVVHFVVISVIAGYSWMAFG